MKFLLLFLCVTQLNAQTEITIGSKKFTESVILGDISSQLASSLNYKTVHKEGLGGTRVLWNALLAGEIDVYPEYSGTLQYEILADKNFTDLESIKKYLQESGIEMIGPLGFNNTYALGMMKKTAAQKDITKISDLSRHPQLIFGFTNEFMDRADGWPALKKRYALPQKNVQGLDHDLAYRGLAVDALQVIDLYSTDAEIEYYDLYVLNDDLEHFPQYYAYFLVQVDLQKNAPDFISLLQKLENSIDEKEMSQLNARVKLQKIPSQQVAAQFIKKQLNIDVKRPEDSFWQDLWQRTKEHLILVFISLSAAILLSIPLGLLAVKYENAGQIILGFTGIIQTIPSLAILVFMIPLLGIGAKPAMMALFLYSLLPIVRNTYSGIKDIPGHLKESAVALGLKQIEMLRFVELPLAARSILAGIKTAAVINVGTATLGALIGAGGYGQPILTGIRLDDTALILSGAVPAAILALLVQGGFDLLEKILIKFDA